jgi:DHA2 family multidrug resistance protein
MLAVQVCRGACVMAYADGFYLVSVSIVLSLSLVAIAKKLQRAAGPWSDPVARDDAYRRL